MDRKETAVKMLELVSVMDRTLLVILESMGEMSFNPDIDFNAEYKHVAQAKKKLDDALNKAYSQLLGVNRAVYLKALSIAGNEQDEAINDWVNNR